MNGTFLKALRLFLVASAGAAFLLAAWIAGEHGQTSIQVACVAGAISALSWMTKELPKP